MPPRFTPKTEQALRAAGWFEGRTVEWGQMCNWAIINWCNDILEDRYGYLPRGYSKISPVAWKVLEEFGGLCIKRAVGETRTHEFAINPLLVSDCASLEGGLENFVWDIGVDVFPLGMIQADAGTEALTGRDQAIAMSSDGRVFALGHSCFLLGHSFDEALENIVTGEKGEEIELSKDAQPGHMVGAIKWRILQRDLRLINGELPDEPELHFHSATTGFYAIRDWEAEAALIVRAFGLAEPCAFVGSLHRKTLRPIIENRSLNAQFPLVDDGFYLGVSYNSRNRLFQLKNASHDLHHYNDITISVRWNDEVRASTGHQPQNAGTAHISAKGLSYFVKGLYHLGLLTPEVEEELGVKITQHEKLEWQLEFEATKNST